MNKMTSLHPNEENKDAQTYLMTDTIPGKNRTVKMIRYPDDAILQSMTKRHGNMADEVIRGLTNMISAAHYHSDFFCAILYDNDCEMIGHANFTRSSVEPAKWFYSDLWILPEYRRQGCATQIVSAARRHLSELNAKTLLCTVEPDNEASLKLHKSLHFEQIETQPFEDFEVNGLTMFQSDIPMNFNIIPLADDFNHLVFICDLLTQPSNVLTLHLKEIPENEYHQFYKNIKETLIYSAPDNEKNYIIRKGIVPIAWLKLNETDKDSLWIKMLIVQDRYRRLGVGTYALQFAEKAALSARRRHIYTHIASDNVIAQSLYKKVGYTIVEENRHQYEDKTESIRYTFWTFGKQLLAGLFSC